MITFENSMKTSHSGNRFSLPDKKQQNIDSEESMSWEIFNDILSSFSSSQHDKIHNLDMLKRSMLLIEELKQANMLDEEEFKAPEKKIKEPKSVIEAAFSAMQLSSSVGNPLHQKMNASHINRVLDLAEKHDVLNPILTGIGDKIGVFFAG